MTDAEIIYGVGLLALALGLFGFSLRSIPWVVEHRANLNQIAILFTLGGAGLLVLYALIGS